MAYDSRCYDLAELFLSDTDKNTEANRHELAQHIQTEIEDWIEYILKPPATITINGTETVHNGESLSYDDVAAFVALEHRWQPPLPLLSITYVWKGDGDNGREGILSPGKQIKVADGMRINAYHTGNA